MAEEKKKKAELVKVSLLGDAQKRGKMQIIACD